MDETWVKLRCDHIFRLFVVKMYTIIYEKNDIVWKVIYLFINHYFKKISIQNLSRANTLHTSYATLHKSQFANRTRHYVTASKSSIRVTSSSTSNTHLLQNVLRPNTRRGARHVFCCLNHGEIHGRQINSCAKQKPRTAQKWCEKLRKLYHKWKLCK